MRKNNVKTNKCKNTLPYSIRHTALLCEAQRFEPGQFAMLRYFKDRPKIDISDGMNIFGIIDDIKNDKDDTTAATQTITIWPLSAGFVFETDQVEDDVISTCHDTRKFAWVSNNGKLTKEPNGYIKPIGVISQQVTKSIVANTYQDTMTRQPGVMY